MKIFQSSPIIALHKGHRSGFLRLSYEYVQDMFGHERKSIFNLQMFHLIVVFIWIDIICIKSPFDYKKTQISIKSKNLYIFSNIKVFHPKVCKQINENYKQISLLHKPASLKLLSRIILSQGVPSFRKRMQLWSVKTQTFSVTGMASMMFPGPV